MMLSELIAQSRIRCDVEVAGWKEAVHLLAAMVAEDLALDVEAVKDALVAREKLGTTAIGNGVGLPHAKLEGIDRPVGALLLLREPLSTNTPDGVQVDLFICFLSPTVGSDFASLARIVRSLRDDAFLRELRAQTTPEAIHALLSTRQVA